MKILLNKLIVNGTKNIDKSIELFFTNKTLNNKDAYKRPMVEGIYGPNGSGKSGIISAVYIYKRLISDHNGINDNFFSNFIVETINKKNKMISIAIIFSLITDTESRIKCYKHLIELAIEDDVVTIVKEEVAELKGNSINDDKFKTLINIEKGEIKYLQTDSNNDLKNNQLYLKSMNLLNKLSIVPIFFEILESNSFELYENTDATHALTSILLLSLNLHVELNKEDEHFDYISNKIINNVDPMILKERLNGWFGVFSNTGALSSNSRDLVSIHKISLYEENISKLEKFIRIFKPNLEKIEIDKKINDDVYYCDKIFVYDGKRINIEFESTGIKKLVKLYSTLRACANGCIAFIDEMDANLHDVYFAKLIEFFKNDSKGQLCFTTHNLEPIDILKENSHSLFFLSDDSRIYSWTKDGNKSPMNKYITGLIPYSPFNVESFDYDILLNED